MSPAPVPDQTDPEIRKLTRRLRALTVASDYSDLFGERTPAALAGDYPAEDLDDQLSRSLQKKYKKRPRNLLRCWNRAQLYLPELIRPGVAPHQVLEMSTAHGAMLEVLRHFGHEVTGNDYVNMVAATSNSAPVMFRDMNAAPAATRTLDDYGLPIPAPGTPPVDWPYRKIIASTGIPMKLFDGGHTPYPFEDKSFDVVLCMQAIEHYCHPKDWLRIVQEFCRISRKTVVVLLNPLMANMKHAPDDYIEAYETARRALRDYDANGFVCISCHVQWGKAVGFKLIAR